MLVSQVLLFLSVAALTCGDPTHFKGKGYGYGEGGGYGYDHGGYDHGGYDYGGYDHGYHHSKGIVIHQPVLVSKPVVVQHPTVEYKKVYIKAPPPPPPPPIWIKKPVIHNVKEWRLVDVPKVGYKDVLVHATPYYSKKGHGKFSKFFDKFKFKGGEY